MDWHRICVLDVGWKFRCFDANAAFFLAFNHSDIAFDGGGEYIGLQNFSCEEDGTSIEYLPSTVSMAYNLSFTLI